MFELYHIQTDAEIYCGDCLEVMPFLDANSIDAIVTDPPYGLEFMGKNWDRGIPSVPFWTEALRVAKPGCHLLAFGGTRTYHRLMCAIEDAGWEIRDCLGWLYGSGFPKSLNISKQLDKMQGKHKPELVPTKKGNTKHDRGVTYATDTHAGFRDISKPQTPESEQWEGYGTALKPAWEPIILARKPLEGTVAENVLKWGCGGLNIDGCRISINPEIDDPRLGGKGDWSPDKMAKNVYKGGYVGNRVGSSPQGRFPANLLHDGSDEVMAVFPNTKSGKDIHPTTKGCKTAFFGAGNDYYNRETNYGDSGSASRFFYCAKASKSERNEGCEGLEKGNNHPTVKPLSLMQYLCRLGTPPTGLILDPFMGSGSTGKAAIKEGFRFIGIDTEEDYCEITKYRIGDIK